MRVLSRCLFSAEEEEDKKRQLETYGDQDPIEEFNDERGVPQNGQEMFQRQAPESTVNMLEANSDEETSPQAEVQTSSHGFLPIFDKEQDKDVTVLPLLSIPVPDEDETSSLKKQVDDALRTISHL